MGVGSLLGVMKMFGNKTVVMSTYLCEYTFKNPNDLHTLKRQILRYMDYINKAIT